jgi:hypothetical protein
MSKKEVQEKFYNEHLQREIELLQKRNKELYEEIQRLKKLIDGNRKQV